MKRKITKYYLILICAVLIITGFITSEVAQSYYKYEVENRLKSMVFSIEYFLLQNKNRNIEYNSFALNYAKSKSSFDNRENIKEAMRITIISYNGTVLGETDTNASEMENHLGRKEVQEAINGSIGSDIRRSRTLDIDMLYIASAIKQQNIIVRVSVPLTELRNIDDKIWLYTLLSILLTLLLALLISFGLANNITKPLNRIISISKEISNGNYNNRINYHSKDELGELAESFNIMADKLEKTVADLQGKKAEVEAIVDSMTNGIVAVDSNNKVILINPVACTLFNINRSEEIIGTNILEHIRNNQLNNLLTISQNSGSSHESEIMLSDERIFRIYTSPIMPTGEGKQNSGIIVFIQDITKIRKLEQIRTEFVSNVTHELKTPITSIRGFIETLKNGSINNIDVANRFLDIIDIEAERLNALIDDILQLSEIESKQYDADLDLVELSSIVNDVFEVTQSSATHKGVALYNNVSDKIMFNANKNKIKQLLLNLADNAIKYNKQNGSVTIYATSDSKNITIFVKDTGIGIPPEHISRIFERFYRIDKGRARDLGGTGLGLSIVKHIVQLYNGDIKVKSEVGEGTEFIIQIPERT